MRTLPSSIFTGKRTTSSRRTSRSTARKPDERLRISAALSNWRWAFSQGESTTAGAATVLTLRSLAGSRALGRSEAHAAGTSILPRMSETESAEVTPAAASEAIADGAVLIDVREKSEYDEAHIPGSVLIPLGAAGSSSRRGPDGPGCLRALPDGRAQRSRRRLPAGRRPGELLQRFWWDRSLGRGRPARGALTDPIVSGRRRRSSRQVRLDR